MSLKDINPYLWLRPLLFLLDPERAHRLAIDCLKKGLGPRFRNDPDPVLRTSVCGLDFPNPVGLAAGFDKQCEIIQECFGFGFGFIELGGVVPQPQPGNTKPRLFRIPEAEAIINRFGLNSDGFETCLKRVIAWHDAHAGQMRGMTGINIAKGHPDKDAGEAYILGLKTFAPYLDFITANVSCPNTPDHRNLQGKEYLGDLLKRVMDAWSALPKQPRVFVKIAPDLDETQMNDIAEVALASGVHGMIIGNTTTSRPASIPAQWAKEAGGLSGKPLFEMSTQVLAKMHKLTEGKIPLIGCGGVSSGADAYAKIRAGASLVQLYSALIYQGPLLVPRVNRELAALLKRDGFKSVAEAVGTGNR